MSKRRCGLLEQAFHSFCLAGRERDPRSPVSALPVPHGIARDRNWTRLAARTVARGAEIAGGEFDVPEHILSLGELLHVAKVVGEGDRTGKPGACALELACENQSIAAPVSTCSSAAGRKPDGSLESAHTTRGLRSNDPG